MTNKGRWNGRLAWAVGSMCLSVWCSQAAVIESNLDKTLPAEPGGSLVVEVDRGSVKIATHDAKEVVVHVFRRTDGVAESRAAALFAEHEVLIKSENGAVKVNGHSAGANLLWNRDRQKMQVRYEIAVPRKFNLDLHTGAGSIECAPIEGKVKANSEGGGLKFSGVDGALAAKTGAGSIHVEKVTGEADLESGGGGIKLGDAAGPVKIETGAGSIEIKNAAGKLMAESHGGSISAGVLQEKSELKTGAGAIHVEEAKAELKIESGGGSLEIQNASAAVHAETGAGSVKVAFVGQPATDSRVHSGGGSIEVALAPSLAFDLNARTGGGSVSSEVPVVSASGGKPERDQIQGKIGEGGAKLDVETGAGAVRIRKGAGK